MNSILATIGNTPLVRLDACAPPNGAELWVKLENLNPSGSPKDRMALAMIEGAERDGLISPGDTVVAHRLAERLGPEAVIVTLAADTGFKYGSVEPYAQLRVGGTCQCANPFVRAAPPLALGRDSA